MKKYLILIIATLFISTWINAQTTEKDPFEKMNKAYEAKMQRMEQDYAQKMQRMQKEYEAKIKKMNAAFESYLKKGFKEVEQTEQAIKPVEVPKPISQPKFEIKTVDKIKTPTELNKVPVPIAPNIVLVEAPAYSIAPIVASPAGMSEYKQQLSVDFFGSTAILYVDNRTNKLKLAAVKPKAFANYWDNFTTVYYQIYIESLIEYAQKTNLNDWGIYQLVDKSSKKLFNSANDREMWKWAILNQAGFQAKIGYSEKTICLMLPFMQQIFGKPYYSIAGTN